MSMKKAVREATLMACKTDETGALTNITGFQGGATGVGSCTLSSTAIYTYTFEKVFSAAPAAAVSLETAGLRAEVATTTTTAVVTLFGYADTSETAGIHSLIVVGKSKN
jgi:hypothetical protein